MRKEDPCEMILPPQNTATMIDIVEDFCGCFFQWGQTVSLC